MKPMIWMFLSMAFIGINADSQERIVFQQGTDGYDGMNDTTIFEDAASNSLGGAVVLLVGATGGSVRRGLIRFDVSMIPNNATIDEAALTLYIDSAGPGAQSSDRFQLYPLQADWGEGNASAGAANGSGSGFGTAASPGDATWLSNRHSQSTWKTPGGDYDRNQETSATITNMDGNDVLEFQSELFASVVQQWVDDSATNFGMIVLGNEAGTRNARRVVSSEGNLERRPQLTIEYRTPNPVMHWSLF